MYCRQRDGDDSAQERTNDALTKLQPPPVCTGRGGRWLRKEWEPPTLLAALSISTRQSCRLLDGLLPLPDEQSHVGTTKKKMCG